jgi:hypothetical protein
MSVILVEVNAGFDNAAVTLVCDQLIDDSPVRVCFPKLNEAVCYGLVILEAHLACSIFSMVLENASWISGSRCWADSSAKQREHLPSFFEYQSHVQSPLHV